ncbi:MAG: hypothetical protein ACYSVY_00270 [Planctomycetota bacterium]|jgi:hypothetical protein
MDFLHFVPAYEQRPGVDWRTHVPVAERERRLKREGETWVTPGEWMALRGEGWRIVEAIWHGEKGSRREAWGDGGGRAG